MAVSSLEGPDERGSVRLRWVKAPTSTELTQLAHKIARRVDRFLERQGLLDRQGLLERDEENCYTSERDTDWRLAMRAT
jgi:hypothetical protein